MELSPAEEGQHGSRALWPEFEGSRALWVGVERLLLHRTMSEIGEGW